MTSRTFARARTDRARSERLGKAASASSIDLASPSRGVLSPRDFSPITTHRSFPFLGFVSPPPMGHDRSRSRSVAFASHDPQTSPSPPRAPRLASRRSRAAPRRDSSGTTTMLRRAIASATRVARREVRARSIERAMRRRTTATRRGEDEEDRADRNGRTGTRARGGGGGRARERGARTNERTSD